MDKKTIEEVIMYALAIKPHIAEYPKGQKVLVL